jgi:hypothetical protein
MASAHRYAPLDWIVDDDSDGDVSYGSSSSCESDSEPYMSSSDDEEHRRVTRRLVRLPPKRAKFNVYKAPAPSAPPPPATPPCTEEHAVEMLLKAVHPSKVDADAELIDSICSLLVDSVLPGAAALKCTPWVLANVIAPVCEHAALLVAAFRGREIAPAAAAMPTAQGTLTAAPSAAAFRRAWQQWSRSITAARASPAAVALRLAVRLSPEDNAGNSEVVVVVDASERPQFVARFGDSAHAYLIGRYAVMYYDDDAVATRAAARFARMRVPMLAASPSCIVVRVPSWTPLDATICTVYYAATRGGSLSIARLVRLCKRAAELFFDGDRQHAATPTPTPPTRERLLRGAYYSSEAHANEYPLLRWRDSELYDFDAWSRAICAFRGDALALAAHIIGWQREHVATALADDDVTHLLPALESVVADRQFALTKDDAAAAAARPPLRASTPYEAAVQYTSAVSLFYPKSAAPPPEWPYRVHGTEGTVIAVPLALAAYSADDGDDSAGDVGEITRVFVSLHGEPYVLHVAPRPRYEDTGTIDVLRWCDVMRHGFGVVQLALDASSSSSDARVDCDAHRPYLIDASNRPKRNAIAEHLATLQPAGSTRVPIALLCAFLRECVAWTARAHGHNNTKAAAAAFPSTIDEWRRRRSEAWALGGGNDSIERAAHDLCALVLRVAPLPDALVRPLVLASTAPPCRGGGAAAAAATPWSEYADYARLRSLGDSCAHRSWFEKSAALPTRFSTLPTLHWTQTPLAADSRSADVWSAAVMNTLSRAQLVLYDHFPPPVNGISPEVVVDLQQCAARYGPMPPPVTFTVFDADGDGTENDAAIYRAVLEAGEDWLVACRMQDGAYSVENVVSTYSAAPWKVEFDGNKAHGYGLQTDAVVRALDYAFTRSTLFAETACGRYRVPTVPSPDAAADEQRQRHLQLVGIGRLLVKNVYCWRTDARDAADADAGVGARPYPVPLPPTYLAAVFAAAGAASAEAIVAHAEWRDDADDQRWSRTFRDAASKHILATLVNAPPPAIGGGGDNRQSRLSHLNQSWCRHLVADVADERGADDATRLAVMLTTGDYELVRGEPPGGDADYTVGDGVAMLREYMHDFYAPEAEALAALAEGVASVLPQRPHWQRIIERVLPAAAVVGHFLGARSLTVDVDAENHERLLKSRALRVERSLRVDDPDTHALFRAYLRGEPVPAAAEVLQSDTAMDDDEDVVAAAGELRIESTFDVVKHCAAAANDASIASRASALVRTVTNRVLLDDSRADTIAVQCDATLRLPNASTCMSLLRLPSYAPVVLRHGRTYAYALFCWHMHALTRLSVQSYGFA